MCFRDVNNQEGDLLAVLFVKPVEGGNLPSERRSGIASKDQHDRLSLAGKLGQLYLRALVQLY